MMRDPRANSNCSCSYMWLRFKYSIVGEGLDTSFLTIVRPKLYRVQVTVSAIIPNAS
jgi:hypothetical protein